MSVYRPHMICILRAFLADRFVLIADSYFDRYNPAALNVDRSRKIREAPRSGADEPLDRPPRRSTVIIGIVSASILFVAIISLFLYRSLVHSEPSHVVVIAGNPSWLGAELIISGETLPHPYTTVIEKSDRYSVPFFIPRGSYVLIAKMNGAEVYRRAFRLDKKREEYIDLPSKVPATQPAMQGN